MVSHLQESSFKFSPLKKEDPKIENNDLLSKIEEGSKSEMQNSMSSNRKVATKVNSPKAQVESCLQSDTMILPFSRAGAKKTENKIIIEELKLTPKVDEIPQIEIHKELLLEVLTEVHTIDQQWT
jgi:hypothetical protein